MSATAILALKITGDGSAAQKALDGTAKTATSFAQKAGKAGDVAGKVLAVGLVAVGAAAFSATKAAAADELAAVKLADSLKQAAGATDTQVAATEKWITAQGAALGVADDELRPALTKLVTVTKDVGEAQKLAALAMDISARRGVSLDSVTTALAKAQTGSVSGLSKLGIRTKDAAGETISLEAAQRKLTDTYSGAAAKAADTQAGKAKIMSVRMGELQEKIGAGLLPVMSKAVDIGLKVVDWIDKNTFAAGALLGVFGLTLTALKLYSVYLKISAAAQAGSTVAQWALNAATAAFPVFAIIAGLLLLAAGFVVAYKKSETFRRIVDKAFAVVKVVVGSVVKVLGVVAGWLKDKLPAAFRIVKTVAVTAFKLAFAPVYLWVKVLGVVAGWLKDKLPAAFSWLKDKATTAVGVVVGKVDGIVDKAKTVILWVGDKLGAGFTKGKELAVDAIDLITAPLQGVIDLVVDLIDWIKNIDWPEPPGWLKDIGGMIGLGFASTPTSSQLTVRSSAGATVTPASTTTVQITIQGAVDPYGTARQIRELLSREAGWNGQLVGL